MIVHEQVIEPAVEQDFWVVDDPELIARLPQRWHPSAI
jgi:hypothetical protein